MENIPLFVNHYQTKLQINNIFFDIYFVLIFTLQVFEQNIFGEFNIYWGFVRSLANIFFASTLILLVSLKHTYLIRNKSILFSRLAM